MAHDRCNWNFSFWAIFCPNSLKNEIKKKKNDKNKTPGDIIS